VEIGIFYCRVLASLVFIFTRRRGVGGGWIIMKRLNTVVK